VYDAIMEDVEYGAWGEFLLRVVTERGWSGGLLLDLACGTGNATLPMDARGFTVMGLDGSAQMLAVARRKLPEVKFVQADLTSFELPERFTLIYSVFDSLNNLLTEEAFSAMARHVYAHLLPGGFFMFDANTTVGLRDLWENGRVEGWAGEIYYRWEHLFDEDSGLARVEAYCETEQGAFTEVHYERPYDAPQLERLLEGVGFTDTRAISFPEGTPAPADADRIWVVTRHPKDSDPSSLDGERSWSV